MKVATYNVNSIRKRLPLVLEWLREHRPDVLCLQETKVQDADFPVAAFADAGSHSSFRGMKSFNGVATLTRELPEKVIHGFAGELDDDAVRIIQTIVRGIPVINTYVPQGYLITSDKYVFKLEWFQRLTRYFHSTLQQGQPALWLGDLNVAPEPIDVYHPDRRANDPDFHMDARNAYKAAAGWGFVDVFRKLHPDRIQYTYWDYYRKAFDHNWGWRIDHIMATTALAERCKTAEVDLEPRKAADPSDHTVVWAEFEAAE